MRGGSIKKKRIFLIILLIVLVGAVALAIWQWDNIQALVMAVTYSDEKLADKKAENDKIISDALEKYPEISVRDLTEEEKQALAEGRLTEEEVLLLLQGKLELETEPPAVSDEPEAVPPTVDENLPLEDDPLTEVQPPVNEPDDEATVTTPSDPPSVPDIPVTPPDEQENIPPEPVPDVVPTVPPTEEISTEPISNNDEEIANLVAKMYVMKAEFTASLTNLENTTLKDYAALSDEEKTSEVKAKMMSEVLSTVAAMEKDCDTQVEEILDRLTELLNEDGKDLSLVDSIETAYKNEKTTTKAEYINKYFK